MTADNANLQRLIAAHPALFSDRAPSFGSYVMPGWYDLVDKLCSDIERTLGNEYCPRVQVRQIKEKFGGLRVYIEFDEGDEPNFDAQKQRVRELIHAAQAQAARTCERCGAPGEIREVRQWETALCENHFAEATKGLPPDRPVRLHTRPAHTRRNEQAELPDVLYLDFDGVLHPESVWWSSKRGAFLDDTLAAHGHQLFEHCGRLEELLLPYPNVQIVLSTSWVRTYSFQRAAKRLPPGLRRRCVGATFHSQMDRVTFEALPRGLQVLADVLRRRSKRWLALDDVNDGWGEHLGDVVLTHEVQGIAHPAVMQDLRMKLSRFSVTS